MPKVVTFRHALERKGGSMTQFARTQGISTNHLYKVLHGERVAGDGLAEAIRDVLEERRPARRSA